MDFSLGRTFALLAAQRGGSLKSRHSTEHSSRMPTQCALSHPLVLGSCKEHSTYSSSAPCLLGQPTAMQSPNTSSALRKTYFKSRPGLYIRPSIVWRPGVGLLLPGSCLRKESGPGS